jgi:hypothetical protein
VEARERRERGHVVDLPAPVIVIVGLAVVTLVAIIVAPFRRVRAEGPLPSDVQARVLLGESPSQIEAELDAQMHEHQGSGSQTVPPTAS